MECLDGSLQNTLRDYSRFIDPETDCENCPGAAPPLPPRPVAAGLRPLRPRPRPRRGGGGGQQVRQEVVHDGHRAALHR